MKQQIIENKYYNKFDIDFINTTEKTILENLENINER